MSTLTCSCGAQFQDADGYLAHVRAEHGIEKLTRWLANGRRILDNPKDAQRAPGR